MQRLPYTFRGIIVPVLTPCLNDSARTLNLSVIPRYAEYLADRKIRGILVNGSTGEGPKLSVKERKSVLETWANAVKSTKQHLMVQIGGAPFPDVIELANHAEAVGVDSLLCLPELYFKPTTPKQLVEYLQMVGEAAPNTPLLYYHMPMLSNVNINMPAFLRAVGDKIPSFVGIKFTSTNLDEGMQAVSVNDNEFVVFLGSNQLIAGGLALGMDSTIPSTLNLFPELGLGILEASKTGDFRKARELQKQLSARSNTILKYGPAVDTVKAAINFLTPLDLGPPRLPSSPLPDETVAAMKKDLKALGCQLLK
ncbi:N-acetylneuraminate lyase-like [Athalia rosae]|uniref:N-acetylneuraminate lyase-like n=1 Tax=Athalia rosae TaxID=37344 RepID=UPI000625A615|nr:N-acetylneuraminate lyase-like [Athalia rosae]